MTILLKQIFGLIKLLNSETGGNQIAAGIAAGFVLGMTPGLSLQSLIIFLFILFFRIQAGAAFACAFFFSFIAWLLDPWFDQIGSWALELPNMQGLYTTLYNLPIVPMTRFNNSIFMGSGILSLLLTPVIFVLAKFIVNKYRDLVVAKIKGTKFWKAVQASGFYKWYVRYDSMFG